ncbi:13801_t:CDS:2, partial [Gigaspora rosea]
QANNTINPISTAVGNACPTAPVVFTATVNSSTSTTVTSVSTITGSTTSFVTFTATQAIPTLEAASDFKSITSKHGFSKCGGIMDIQDFRILYSASKKTFIPLFKGRSPIVVNNATGRLYVQVYGTSIALEFDGIPCFGARNSSPCTSGNVIDS